MSLYPLNPGAELFIPGMHLAPAEETVVRQCILKYSMPENLGDLFTWALYRVWNAVKYVFGRSDWQCAEHIIYLRAKEIVVIQENTLNPCPQDQTEVEIVLDLLADAIKPIIHKLLALCLRSHDRVTNPSEKMKQQILDFDLNTLIQKLRNAVHPSPESKSLSNTANTH